MDKGPRVAFGRYPFCELKKDKYFQNGRTVLTLVAYQDDAISDVYEGEQIATCTANIPEVELAKNEVLIKDYSENTGMIKALTEAGIIEATGREAKSGFVTLPICRLLVDLP